MVDMCFIPSLFHSFMVLFLRAELILNVFILLFFSYGEFLAFSRQKKNKTYIVKPDSGSQGRGIFLTKSPKVNIKVALSPKS